MPRKILTPSQAMPLFLREMGLTADEYFADPKNEKLFDEWYLTLLKKGTP